MAIIPMLERRQPSGTALSKRGAVSHSLTSQLRVDSVRETDAFREWESERMSLGLPSDFDTLLPLTKIRLIANSGNRAAEIEHFVELGARVNALRSVGGSLRCLSSGLTSYANFCSLLSRPFMPPTERSVLLWSATFAPGRTFKNYIAHLRKGCALLGAPSGWATKAVYPAAEGLRKAKKGTFAFANFLFMTDVFSLVGFLGWGSEFALLAFISFLSPLRVPSDALRLRRAFRDDPISEPVGQHEKALIGVRVFKGPGVLVVKTACGGGHLEGGRMLKPTCVCSHDFPQADPPPHGIWPRTRARISAGSLCLPSYAKNNFNRQLEFRLRGMDRKDAPRYTAKAFRMGVRSGTFSTRVDNSRD